MLTSKEKQDLLWCLIGTLGMFIIGLTMYAYPRGPIHLIGLLLTIFGILGTSIFAFMYFQYGIDNIRKRMWTTIKKYL
jgi:hypothetical protein